MGIPFLQGGVQVLFYQAEHFPSNPNVPGTKAKTPSANPMRPLLSRLFTAGVKRKFLDKVVLPSWWEDSISATPGGLREAAGYICAHQTPSLPVPRPAGDATRGKQIPFRRVGDPV
jgi:hypothetical protein